MKLLQNLRRSRTWHREEFSEVYGSTGLFNHSYVALQNKSVHEGFSSQMSSRSWKSREFSFICPPTLLYSCRGIGFCFWIQRRYRVKRLWLFGPGPSSVVTCVWLSGVFSHSGTSSSSTYLVYNSSPSDPPARLLHQHVVCLWPLTSLCRRSRSGSGSSSCVPGINTSLTLCDRLKCECLHVLTAGVKVIIHVGEDDICIWNTFWAEKKCKWHVKNNL